MRSMGDTRPVKTRFAHAAERQLASDPAAAPEDWSLAPRQGWRSVGASWFASQGGTAQNSRRTKDLLKPDLALPVERANTATL